MKKTTNPEDKYTYKVEWSEEDQCFIARCLEFQSLGTHGKTREKALSEMSKVVAETIKWMAEEKEEIPLPLSMRKYSGKLTLRLPPEIHRMVETNAIMQGISINRYILSSLTKNSYK